jgi:WD40 repeat protein/class 3 adenylate cyclase
MLVFLFTDIEGSTQLWEEHTDEMGAVIARHDEILREQVEGHGGRITKHTGDGITAAFEAGEPLACALEAQARFGAEPWGEIGALPIRMGLHAGEAEFQASAGTAEGDYFGPPVNATARVMSAAWGGQILLTPEVTQASALPVQATLLDLGQHLLKNVSAPQTLFQLVHPQLARREFPAPRTLSGQSIRHAVEQQGQQMAGLQPQAMGISLVVSTLLPVLQGELDPESGALEGNLGVLEDLGADSLRGFVAKLAGRLRIGERLPAREIESLLQVGLQTQWQAGGERALALRADASRLLQAVHGVEAAMAGAADEIKEGLARGLGELGTQFGEFRWMLAGVQDTLAEVRARQALQLALQREQLDLQRQQLVKTNLLLHRQREGPPTAELTVEGEVDLEPQPELPPADMPCPYKGLAAFEADDAQFFFGREELVAELTAWLAGTRFLAVVGPSGSGKSSLVRAGLLPAIWADTLPGSEDWQTLVITPGAHPLEELAVRISLLNGFTPDQVLRGLEDDPRALDLIVKHLLADQPEDVRLLLVVDQFEEVFALCRDEAERRAFIETLLHAVDAENSRVVVVPTIRADFYGRCAEYPDLAAKLQENVLVGPMAADELRQAVELPAAVVGLRLEPGLVDTILDDVAGEPGALPLMSHALVETWERRRGRTLTLAGYAASGGVAGAIAQTADSVYAGLEPEDQALARHIFLRLTELGEEGTQDTRRRVAPGELVRSAEEARAVGSLLRTLADARLVTTGEDSVEVAHEALIREWPALRGWLEDDREGLRIHRHLTDSAQEWQRLGREPGELYRGARLAAAGEWAEAYGEALNPLEWEFLAASQELARRREAEREAQRERELEAAHKLAAEQEKRAAAEQRRAEEQAQAAGRLRRRALLLAGAMIAAVVLAALAFLAFRQADQNADAAQVASTQAVSERYAAETAQALEADQRAMAETQAEARATAQAEAEAAKEEAQREAGIGLASQAGLQMVGPNPERAVLLALEAVEEYPYSWQAERALAEAVLNHRIVLDLQHGAGDVNSAELSADGTRILTTGDHGVVKVWDVGTGQELLSFTTYDSDVAAFGRAHWSPSGDRILTWAMGGPRVWDATSGALLFDLSTYGHWVGDWSPDGTRITTFYGGEADPVTVWDASTGEALYSLPGAESISSVHWSPDGTRILTEDGSIWDAATGKKLLALPVKLGAWTIFPGWPWSPDGTRIVTSRVNEPGRIWNAATGKQVLAFERPAGGRFAHWSPTGDRIMTEDAEQGLARVWDAGTGAELFQLPGAGHGIWSPDGRYVVCGREGGEVQVWDAASGSIRLSFIAHTGSVSPKQWLPSGDHFITTSGEGSAKVWDASQALSALGCQPSCPDSPIGGWFTVAAWSPDGKQVARGFVDGTLTVWDVATGDESLTLQYEPLVEHMLARGVVDLSWSPDGTQLLAGCGDGMARVWDVASGAEILRVQAFDDSAPVETTWSPDGARFVTTIQYGPAQVWDATTGEELLVFAEHIPYAASWSPDGRFIVTADGGANGSAKVWDAVTGQVLLDLYPEDFGHGVAAVAWSPDGMRIVAFSDDELGRVFDADSGEELLTFPGVAGAWDALWSPSGDRILISGMGAAVRVFDASTGNELIGYGVATGAGASWSPDGKHVGIGDWVGNLSIYPAWQSLEELTAYARDCCVFRQLTPEEREQFGLSAR